MVNESARFVNHVARPHGIPARRQARIQRPPGPRLYGCPAYAHGIFPWYNEDPILWFSPDPRMVLRLPELVVNRTLAKNIRRKRFEIKLDTSFRQVIRDCA